MAHIYPGAKRHTYPSHLEVFDGKLYYSGIPQWGPYNLIAYDGENTPVVYILNGTNNSSPYNLRAVGDNLYFAAFRDGFGIELNKLRKGSNTPTQVMDMMPGTASSAPSGLVNYNGNVMYSAIDKLNGRELRKYNGSPKSSPSLVFDHSPGNDNSRPMYHSTYKGKMYFNADDGVHGQELWMYDGTNPPSMVSDFYVGNRGSNPGPGIVYNDKLYYKGNTGYSTAELLQFDGDTSIAVTKLNIGTGTSPSYLTLYKGDLYFQGRTAAAGYELMKYDGDTAVVVADIYSGSASSSPRYLKVYNGILYFSAQDDGTGTHLWSYDGTNAPKEVGSINPTANAGISYLTISNNVLYFAAVDGTNSSKSELWRVKGNNAPEKVSVSTLYYIAAMTDYKGKLYVSAWEGSNQPELYVFDGENKPTMVEDIRPGTSGSSPNSFTEYHGKLYFSCSHASFGNEIWSFDGYGTNYFDYVSGVNSFNPQHLYAFGDRMYFTGIAGDKGQEFYSLKAPNSTDLKEKVDTQNVLVYPNPTNGILSVSMNNASIKKLTVINIAGQVVHSENNANTIDVSFLNTGVYFVKVETDQNIGFKKFIKE